MSAKLRTISLPAGRKQSKNGYFKLLVHFLHEHTIDDLRERTIQDRAQFNHRFLSPHRVGRREHCSTFLRNIVQNNGSKKQLEIVTQLGNLRSAIEDAYRGNFSTEYSIADSLQKLIDLTIRPEGWMNRVRVWNPETLNAFEQFGGLYVLLDLLFLDHRFRNLEPEFVTPTKLILTPPFRKIPFTFFNKLISERNDLKVMFLKSEVLLTLLVDNYRLQCDIEGPLMRNKIAQSFKLLAQSKLEGVDFGPSGIVTSLTETAVASHFRSPVTGSDQGEVICSLQAIEQLTNHSSACRADFLAVDGSIDMLIDLFGDSCEGPWYHPCGPYEYLFLPLIPLLSFMGILSPLIIILGSSGSYQSLVDIPRFYMYIIMIVVSAIILFILYLIYVSDDSYNASQKCWRAGNVLVSIARDLHTNQRALERFRQRDACRLMAQYINSEDHTRSRYFNAISFLSNMISGHRRRQIGDIEVERRRLQELQIKRSLKDGSSRRPSWKEDFDTILEFIQNYD